MKIRSVFAALCIAGTIGFATQGSAATISLTPITNNSGISSTVASQVSIEVTNAGAGLADITITNNGTALTDFVITQFYIDDDQSLLLGFDALPTNWGDPATPGNLPAGNPIGFDADLSADANNSQIKNGIDLNESVVFTVMLNGINYADFETALFNHDIRIGLHIQSIGVDEDSDSFVSAPEPTSLLLLTAGALLTTTRRRRSM